MTTETNNVKLTPEAIGALIDIGTSRQGAVLPLTAWGGRAIITELTAAGLIGPDRGLTRLGGIIRDREMERALDAAF